MLATYFLGGSFYYYYYYFNNQNDYSDGPYSVTIPAGETTMPFNIEIFDDTRMEDDETFQIYVNDTFSLPPYVLIGSVDNVTVIIVDNESKLRMYLYYETIHTYICNLCMYALHTYIYM